MNQSNSPTNARHVSVSMHNAQESHGSAAALTLLGLLPLAPAGACWSLLLCSPLSGSSPSRALTWLCCLEHQLSQLLQLTLPDFEGAPALPTQHGVDSSCSCVHLLPAAGRSDHLWSRQLLCHHLLLHDRNLQCIKEFQTCNGHSSQTNEQAEAPAGDASAPHAWPANSHWVVVVINTLNRRL